MEKQSVENVLDRLRLGNGFQVAFLSLLGVLLPRDSGLAQDSDMKNRALNASITQVQPMTGIVLWTTNEAVQTAPIYYDAFVSIDRTRASESLKGLLPGETRSFSIQAGGVNPSISIECDRLIPGQIIEYEADLSH